MPSKVSMFNDTDRFMGTAYTPTDALVHFIRSSIPEEMALESDEVIVDFGGLFFRTDYCVTHDLLMKYGILNDANDFKLDRYEKLLEDDDYMVDELSINNRVAVMYSMKLLSFIRCLIDHMNDVTDFLDYLIIIANAVFNYSMQHQTDPTVRQYYSYHYIKFSKLIALKYHTH